MNNAIGLFLVFGILVAVVVATNWQNKTGRKLTEFAWYRYGKMVVLGLLILGAGSIVLLSIYGATLS
ncbi:hypothetical protein Ga0123461_0658 [Mariprofundus aestuarium]|uniref:Uncharacterized protein n=1 Tax=Mariprofundus aestuarium TaxID=1921086 RepID=A0A2K8L2A5_MARES|nr:hypothetical protein [Mariprofundus aestuarium]ATX79084.1 hypothetical protein Ga0123461_0658 [Mariprofundus aestuarium]